VSVANWDVVLFYGDVEGIEGGSRPNSPPSPHNVDIERSVEFSTTANPRGVA